MNVYGRRDAYHLSYAFVESEGRKKKLKNQKYKWERKECLVISAPLNMRVYGWLANREVIVIGKKKRKKGETEAWHLTGKEKKRKRVMFNRKRKKNEKKNDDI